MPAACVDAKKRPLASERPKSREETPKEGCDAEKDNVTDLICCASACISIGQSLNLLLLVAAVAWTAQLLIALCFKCTGDAVLAFKYFEEKTQSFRAHRGKAVAIPQRITASGLMLFAHELADLTDKTVMPYFRKSISVANKADAGAFDPVTAADRAAEKIVRKAIQARFPDHGIIGEEFGNREGDRYRWVIDPIDGTRAFITGAPMWGSLIGLTCDGTPTLGLMSQPFTRERYWGDTKRSRWRGADGRQKVLKVRPSPSLSGAMLMTTHPDLFEGKERAAFAAVKDAVRMTRFGGDCYSYCLLAAGFVDLVIEAGLKPYDIVPLIPIIEGAGGIVTTWDGKPATAGGRIIAAGDARVHRQAMALLQGAL